MRACGVASGHFAATIARSCASTGESAGKIREFYGDDPSQSPDYCRIASERHTARFAPGEEAIMFLRRQVIGGRLHHTVLGMGQGKLTIVRSPRGAQVIYPKDLGPIQRRGDRVVRAGAQLHVAAG